MADSTKLPVLSDEKTFTQYRAEQAKYYALHRQDYSPELYNGVLLFHASTGGENNFVVDVGCGAGNVTCSLSKHFRKAVGLDASPAMIGQARDIAAHYGTITLAGEPPSFHVTAAESLGADLEDGALVPEGSVDLITAGNAAHWFDMPRFWKAAHRALRPHGTVALWIPGEGIVHPSTPGASEINELLTRFVEDDLFPYFAPGNFTFRNRYRNLMLPWQVQPPVEGFPKSAFERREWDMFDKPFLAGGDRPLSLDIIESTVSTMSPVTRWREAHPDLVGTEEDTVKRMRRKMEEILQRHGVKPGEERVRMMMDGTLLLFKKSG